ncbi:MAG TPA: glycoside hydrolase family 97 N-terminal domain-containing protein, partial [Chitinophagaceae bacterium]
MRKALFIFSVALAIPTLFASAQGAKSYALQSPDGHLRVSVYVDTSIRWSISAGDQITMLPSQIGMQLDNRVIGEQARVISAKSRHVNEVIAALNYKKDTINNNYNQLLLACRGDFTVEFRV